MPFVIAGLVYGLLAVPALAAVGGLCLLRRRPAARPVLLGAAGSVLGFLLGGVAAVAIGVAVPAVSTRVGATLLVVPCCVGLAMLGLAAGGAAPILTSRADA